MFYLYESIIICIFRFTSLSSIELPTFSRYDNGQLVDTNIWNSRIFANCTNLTTFIYHQYGSTILNYSASFENCPKLNSIILKGEVSAEVLNSYKTTVGWNNNASIITASN